MEGLELNIFTFKILIVVLFVLIIFSSYVFAVSLDIPPRPSDALTGSAFVPVITSLSLEERENTIYEQIALGNIPEFMRTLQEISVTENIGGTDKTAIYYVTPDYMAIGSNDDYFLTPMSPLLAQRVADLLKCSLPARKMVNDIYLAAEVKLAPKPIPWSPAMTTVPVFDDHNTIVKAQRNAVLAEHPIGELIGGTKKDVVITPKLATAPAPGRVAIYGWHQLNGQPIQPLYLGHYDFYADYSHGIRLIRLDMTLDGTATTVPGILADPDLNVLLSDEGVILNPRYPVDEPTPTPTPTPINLVKNGSFEEGDTGGVGNHWKDWKTDTSNTIKYGMASKNIHDGTYSQYWAGNGTEIFHGGVYQVIEVTPYYRYRLKGWLKRQSTFEGTFMHFGYDLSGGEKGDSISVIYTEITGSTDNVWVSFDETISSTGDKLTIFFSAGHTGVSGGSISYFYIDQVSMEPLGPAETPTPTPSPTPKMESSGFMLSSLLHEGS
jgi:hypothetical protein